MKNSILFVLLSMATFVLQAQNITQTLRHAPLGNIHTQCASDGKRLASWQGNTLKIWDIAGNSVLQTLTHTDKEDIDLSTDLNWAVTHNDTEIHLWDVANAKLSKTFTNKQLPTLEPVDGSIPSLKFYKLSANAKYLAIAMTHGKILLWDWKAEKVIHQFDFMAIPPDEIIFSADGKYMSAVAMTSTSGSTQANVWEVETKTSLTQASSTSRYLVDNGFKYFLKTDNYENTFYLTPFVIEIDAINKRLQLNRKDDISKMMTDTKGLLMISVHSSIDGKFVAIQTKKDGEYQLNVVEVASKKSIIKLSKKEEFSVSFQGSSAIAVGNAKGGVDIYACVSQLTNANNTINSSNENKQQGNNLKKPVVTLVNPSTSPSSSPASYLQLTFEVTDIDNTNQINLLLNGKDLNVAPRTKMIGTKMLITYSVDVQEGVNTFEFGAMNIVGSDSKQVIITYSKTGMNVEPTMRGEANKPINLISPYANVYDSPSDYLKINAESKGGKPVQLKTDKGEVLTHTNQKDNQYSFDVTLREGVNNFELTNGEHTEKLQLSYNKEEPRLPQIWAVVVGVSQYQDTKMNLKYADADAKMLYDFLKSPKGGKLDDEHLILLTNQQATRANIIKEIKNRFSKAFDNDMVMLYIAGHGMPDPTGNEVYFLCHDAQKNNLEGTAVSQTDIQKALATTRAKKKVWFADACHSGGMGISEGLRGAEDESSYQVNKLLTQLSNTNKGMALLTASAASETSREADKWGGGHGVFTYYLAKGLQGEADQNKDGIVNIRELYEFVYRGTTSETQGNQHPELKGTFDNRLPLSVFK